MAESNRAQAPGSTNGQTEPDGADQPGRRPVQESPLDRQLREAELRQKIAEAEQKAEAARQLRIKSMIPDLSTVPASKTEVAAGDRGIGSSALTFGALDRAAEKIAAHIARVNPRPDGWRVLVTSDQDLASPDALYHEVKSGLDQLAQTADTLLSQTQPRREEPAPTDGQEGAYGFPLPALLTAVVPQVLSLMSAQRSLTSGAITTTDLAAATAVAGALETELSNRVSVLHDEFRLVQPGRIQAADTLVAEKRQTLVSRKIELTEAKAVADAELASAQDAKKAAEKALADAGASPDSSLVDEVARTRALVKQHATASSDAGVKLSLVDGLISAMDAFTASIRVIPEGGRRSPLGSAALHDQLHAGADNRLTHVLLVKAQPAQFSQLINDKPLWFEDKFSTLVEVNVTYMLIATGDSSIARAGTASATAVAYGRLGSNFEFDNSRVYLSSVPD